MKRKRKKPTDPDEALDPDSMASLVEIVPEAPPFETVAEIQESDTQLLPPTTEMYRLKQSTKDIHSSVIYKLSRVCRLPELTQKIERVAVVMKQVQLEAWHLANLHVLRCLKEGEDVPDLEQMFFYRCCAAVLRNTESRDQGSATPKYPNFHRICFQYWSGRERKMAYASESIVNGADMINEVAKLMEINAKNILALHFHRQLHQFVRFRYAPEGKLEMKYKDVKRPVDSCYRVKVKPILDENKQPTGRTAPVWAEWDV